MQLHPNTTTDDIKRRLHHSTRQRARATDQRRQYLEKVARMVSQKDVELRLDDGSPRCTADTDKDAIIWIPHTKHKQPVTDLRGIHWDLLLQETELMHELGHVLYTDFESVNDIAYNVNGSELLFRRFFNAAEDGAIETQLAKNYNVGEDLTIKNANLVERNKQMKKENNQGYGLFEAICKGALDMGYYDSGEFEKIMNGKREVTSTGRNNPQQALQRIHEPFAEYMGEMLSTPNGYKRVLLTKEFWNNTLQPELGNEQGDTPMNNDVSGDAPNNDPEDADGLEDGDEHVKQSSASPDTDNNEEPNTNSQEQAGNGSGSGDQSQEDKEGANNGSSPTDGSSGDDGKEDSNGSGSSDSEEVDGDKDDVGPTTSEDIKQAEDDMEVKYRNEVDNEQANAGSNDDEVEDEAKKLLKVVQDGAGKKVNVNIDSWMDNDSKGWSKDRWNKARNVGERVKDLLERQLQRERASETRRGERFGRLDTQKMMDGKRGNPRIWKQENRPGDKDYAYSILLDRSGSMNGLKVQKAELAAGMFAYALKELGSDVSIMSFYDENVDVELPFGGDMDSYNKQVFTSKVGGGTPTTDALEIASKRVEEYDDRQSCIIVITDGMPNSTKNYLNVLEKTNTPVWGLYIDGEDNHSQYFDHFVTANSGEIVTKVQKLAREVVL